MRRSFAILLVTTASCALHGAVAQDGLADDAPPLGALPEGDELNEAAVVTDFGDGLSGINENFEEGDAWDQLPPVSGMEEQPEFLEPLEGSVVDFEDDDGPPMSIAHGDDADLVGAPGDADLVGAPGDADVTGAPGDADLIGVNEGADQQDALINPLSEGDFNQVAEGVAEISDETWEGLLDEGQLEGIAEVASPDMLAEVQEGSVTDTADETDVSFRPQIEPLTNPVGAPVAAAPQVVSGVLGGGQTAESTLTLDEPDQPVVITGSSTASIMPDFFARGSFTGNKLGIVSNWPASGRAPLVGTLQPATTVRLHPRV